MSALTALAAAKRGERLPRIELPARVREQRRLAMPLSAAIEAFETHLAHPTGRPPRVSLAHRTPRGVRAHRYENRERIPITVGDTVITSSYGQDLGWTSGVHAIRATEEESLQQ